jgi:hypothetical protein
MRRPRLFVNTILGIVIGAGACSQRSTGVTDPGRPSFGLVAGNIGLASCQPLPPAITSATLGPDGGTIDIGPHRLTFAKGSLKTTVTITAEIADGGVNAVRFGPEGLTFGPGVKLALSYSNCPGLTIQKLRVVYADDLLNPLEVLASKADPKRRTISADIHHFSIYAVAY